MILFGKIWARRSPAQLIKEAARCLEDKNHLERDASCPVKATEAASCNIPWH